MDELVALVSKKTGIPEAQARTAAETTLAFLKKKLPPQVASQIDGVIAGNGAVGAGNIGDMAKSLGGVLGK
jgi:hypothetical protein